MNLIRLLSIVFLIAVQPAQAGVMALSEPPRFQLHQEGVAHLLSVLDEGDFSLFLQPHKHKLKFHKQAWRNWRLSLLTRKEPPLPPVLELPELPSVEEAPMAVWEPPVLGLMMLGLVGLMGARWRLRQFED